VTEPVKIVRAPSRLEYTYTAGTATSRFLRGMAEGRIMGQRCPQCGKVYIPPRGSCPVCAVPTEEEVQLSNRGTVTTFCIVNIPSQGLSVPVPYVCADILLDGADVPFMHIIQECPTEDVRMGMRVEAVWVEPDQLQTSVESIRYFRPSGEPDVEVQA
jgi:hypothetical protein